MPGSFADKVRGLLASDVYTEKGRLRSDDLLVRERVGHGLAAAAARVREQPFPPAAVMEPIRAAERLVRAIEDAATTVRGLPLLNADKVWDRVRRAGLDELLQFDWTLVGEADALAADMTAAPALDQFSVPAQEARLAKIRSVIADRQRYIEIS